MIEHDIVMYGEEGKNYAQHGDMQKAQLMLTKKKLAEKEVQYKISNFFENFENYSDNAFERHNSYVLFVFFHLRLFLC